MFADVLVMSWQYCDTQSDENGIKSVFVTSFAFSRQSAWPDCSDWDHFEGRLQGLWHDGAGLVGKGFPGLLYRCDFCFRIQCYLEACTFLYQQILSQ